MGGLFGIKASSAPLETPSLPRASNTDRHVRGMDTSVPAFYFPMIALWDQYLYGARVNNSG
jgi:hypothetical protein